MPLLQLMMRFPDNHMFLGISLLGSIGFDPGFFLLSTPFPVNSLQLALLRFVFQALLRGRVQDSRTSRLKKVWKARLKGRTALLLSLHFR